MTKKRCSPGDMVRIDYSKVPGLEGRIAVVNEFSVEHGRWWVTVLGTPFAAIGIESGRMLVGSAAAFRDSSLTPLRGDELETNHEQSREVSHG